MGHAWSQLVSRCLLKISGTEVKFSEFLVNSILVGSKWSPTRMLVKSTEIFAKFRRISVKSCEIFVKCRRLLVKSSRILVESSNLREIQ